LGDHLFWARNVAGKAQTFAEPEVGRLTIRMLEKGELAGNSRRAIEGIAEALGRPYDHLRAYIEGQYGPPSRETAELFLSGAAPPAGEGSPEQPLPRLYREALGLLAEIHERSFLKEARLHRQKFAAHSSNGFTAEVLARQIYEMAQEAKGKAVARGVEPTEEGLPVARSRGAEGSGTVARGTSNKKAERQ
jgi:hypothetical protein